MAAFQVLTVCSGNICRSPLAEQLLRAALTDITGISVSSSGTVGLIDHPMTEQAQAISLQYGGAEPRAHRARALSADHVREADLVLGMAREHRRASVEMVPRASRYTFTLRELARLVPEVTDMDLLEVARMPLDDINGRLAAAIEVAASMRGVVESLADAADDDVVDPYRQSDAIYAESAKQLVPAVNIVSAYLRRAATCTEP